MPTRLPRISEFSATDYEMDSGPPYMFDVRLSAQRGSKTNIMNVRPVTVCEWCVALSTHEDLRRCKMTRGI